MVVRETLSHSLMIVVNIAIYNILKMRPLIFLRHIEVENQLEKKIKILRSNRGSEYE